MFNVGLVLEGGAMRGVYTAGVLDAFLENNIIAKTIYGVSAGACHSYSYISKQKGRNMKITLNYIKDHRYLSIRNLLTKGEAFGMEFMFKTIPEVLVPFDFKTYEETEQNLIIVTTNCITGRAEYFSNKNGEDLFYIGRASASMPLVSKDVFINGVPHLDGGIADPIPILKSMRDGNEKNIVVLTRNEYYRKSYSKKTIWLLRRRYPKYKGLIRAYENRHLVYNKSIEIVHELEKKGKVFIIRPTKPIIVGRMERNVDRLLDLYLDGCKNAMEQNEKLLNWINN